MGWILAIVAIILVVTFRKIFIPLAAVMAVALGGYVLYDKADSDRTERARIRNEKKLSERVDNALRNQSSVSRDWKVQTERDPASGKNVPRSASVTADSDLCRLEVEQRINGTRLAGIYCADLPISYYSDIEVKFSNRLTSDKMKLQKFSNGVDVYISSDQYVYSGNLAFDVFLKRMEEADRLALLLTFEGSGPRWISFSLAEATPALITIGAIPPKQIPLPTPSPSQPTQKNKEVERSQIPAKNPIGSSGTPANTEPDNASSNGTCQRGIARSGNECVKVAMPPNAVLDYTGSNWTCARGFSRTGNECVKVLMPPNAVLDYTGSNWACERGFSRSGNECRPVGVIIPE